MGVVDEAVVEELAVEAEEAEVAVEAVEGMTTMTTTMTTTTTRAAPHPRPSRVFPDVYDNEIDVEYDDEPTVFSTTPRCSNNWPKSCKINARRPRVDASQASPPPTPSRRPTKTDDALP